MAAHLGEALHYKSENHGFERLDEMNEFFSIYQILPATLGLLGSTAQSVHEADNLTTVYELIV
jgi:hypothetical protein